jgi:glycosyltransferase involved in cell wall biosynthesis
MIKRSKKKIAILTNYPSDHSTFSGGVETATAALLEGLRSYEDEFEFHVVSAPNSLQSDIDQQRDGFQFHFISVPHFKWLRPRFVFRVLKAAGLLKTLTPDLVHCQDNMSLAMAGILGDYPRVFTVHGVKKYEANKRTGWERWSATADAILEPYIYKRFNNFICISDYAEKVIGDGKRKFRIPNPVRSSFFEVQRKGIDQPMLLFVGALSALKRPLDLIMVHKNLREKYTTLETVLCGETEDARYLRQLRGAAINGVRFEGRVSEESLIELMRKSSALVLPSMQENSPIVLGEAMAAGVPVVATRVGGIPEMLEDGHAGFLYNAGNVNELEARLEVVLGSPDLAMAMGRWGREKALSTYHPGHIAKKTTEVYRTLLREYE